MLTTYNYEVGDIVSGTLTVNTWMHLGLTWAGPVNHFKTFVNGNHELTRTTGENHRLCPDLFIIPVPYVIALTVNPNTLWSYFHADISVTACHMPTKLYTLT